MKTFFIDRVETPIGQFLLVVDDVGRLCASGWTVAHPRMERSLAKLQTFTLIEKPNPNGISKALTDYFDGDFTALDDLPVAESGTEFQRTVWRTLRSIPCGQTWSYAELAQQIGRPTAVRAGGLANGSNPVGLVVPCHRVIGSNGKLTGYGGGLQRKRWLLNHERPSDLAELPLFASPASPGSRPCTTSASLSDAAGARTSTI